MNRPLDALPEGTKLAGYVIGRVLGRGGFGVTYFGHDALFPDTKVAIKEFLPAGLAVREPGSKSVRPSDAASESDFHSSLVRFEEEARTLVAVRHPNIVEVQRYVEANGTAYVVMKYEEGRSLAELLGRNSTLSASELGSIIPPLLDGLGTVHQRNYLHRDIKPANIYMRAKDHSPVLLDFGAARQAMGAERKSSLTEIVTPGYAPFEQYFRKGDQGPWTDIYSLGATFYRCITGSAPPEAPERIRRDPMVPAIEAGRGEFPEEVLTTIDRMLEVDERKRPQSVGEVYTLLRLETSARWPAIETAETLLAGEVGSAPASKLYEVLPRAEQGDADAQCDVGQIYERGLGVPQDLRQAATWYQRAAEQGYERGLIQFGRMLWAGLGVQQNAVRAVECWLRPAEQGVADAQRRLGDAYALGKGVPWSYHEGAGWYRKAGLQGDAQAKLNLIYVESVLAYSSKRDIGPYT